MDQKTETKSQLSAESLASSAKAAGKKGPPPVHLWNPPFCGDLDMRIARDGNWFYLGTPIGRKPLVRLFASILRRDGDDFFLVTPVEKVGIRVDDAPFVAVDFDAEGSGRSQKVTFTTNVDDTVTAAGDRPIRVLRHPETGEVSPYVLVRSNLEALIDRKSFYRLVEICTHEMHGSGSWFGLWSSGVFFPFIPSAELE
ncbi:MAG: DUF1285 domain-containing protein [Rhodobacteraceae bacterium]|nr:DUF1285 domain-containing protein [Paracoccaceae bacterium]